MGSLGLKAQLIRHGSVHTHDPDVRLVGQADEMRENANLSAVGLYLTEDDIPGVQGGGDSFQIPLLSWEPENLGVADDARKPSWISSAG
jgi:hypothetical protein